VVELGSGSDGWGGDKGHGQKGRAEGGSKERYVNLIGRRKGGLLRNPHPLCYCAHGSCLAVKPPGSSEPKYFKAKQHNRAKLRVVAAL
jgi:hypothetical protein